MIGLLACAASPATGQGAPEDDVRGAVAGLDAVTARFRREGLLPRPEELAGSREALARAANAYAARGDQARAAEALIQLTRLERMIGRWDAAAAHAEKAIAAARAARNREHEARALLGRSLVELSRNGLARAAADVEEAIRVAGDKVEVKLRFDLLAQQTEIQTAMGKYSAATETLDRAFALPGLKDEQLVYGHLDRGGIFVHMADRCDHEPVYEVCLDMLKRSRTAFTAAGEAARRLGWGGIEKLARDQIGNAGVKEKVVGSRQRMAALTGEKLRLRPEAPSDVLVTELFAAGGGGGPMGAAAARLHRESQRQDKGAPGFLLSSSTRTFHTEGLLRQMNGDHPGALASFRKAVDSAEQDQRALPDETSRRAFFAEYFPVYLAATEELLDAKRFDEAFAMVERSRARSMADLLAGRSLDVGGVKERALYGDIVRLDREIATKLAARMERVSNGQPPGELDADLARLRASRQRLVDRLATDAPRLQTLTGARLVSLADLQALARRDRCEVLEYLVTDSSVLIFHISSTEMRARRVFLPRAALTAAVTDLRNQLTVPPTGPFDHRRARELYLQLYEPMRRFIGSERLLVLPHDILTALPFEVLEAPDGTPIGTRVQVSYAPSATIYAGLRPWAPKTPKKLLAAANPDLEREAHEVERVASVYDARRRPANEALITKRKLRERAPGADVVHLSVHGTFDGAEPLLSHLSLASDGADDGRLTAAEMFGLSLGKTRLVVLSACESGRTESSIGNEELGMVRGLLYAGAGSLVLSRWSVNAVSTAKWMETFHREARMGGLADAARAALNAVRKDHEHPYYWAAFMLLGRQQ